MEDMTAPLEHTFPLPLQKCTQDFISDICAFDTNADRCKGKLIFPTKAHQKDSLYNDIPYI
jgi:hypothetical protein